MPTDRPPYVVQIIELLAVLRPQKELPEGASAKLLDMLSQHDLRPIEWSQ